MRIFFHPYRVNRGIVCVMNILLKGRSTTGKPLKRLTDFFLINTWLKPGVNNTYPDNLTVLTVSNKNLKAPYVPRPFKRANRKA